MNRKHLSAAALAAACLANAAQAQAQAPSADYGRWQIKLMATGVLPDGKIDRVKHDAIGLPAGSQTRATDTVVPTLAIEYFAAPNVSIETICCLTKRRVAGAGALGGAELVNHVLILPATVTVKRHIDAGPFRPYVGVGPSLFVIMGEKPGATARALGVTRVRMRNELGVALQGGVDIPVSPTMGVSFDVKRYFIGTTARFYTAAGVKALETEHKLDPWIVSGGVTYRF